MHVAIAMLAGALVLLCVASLAYVYRHQRQGAVDSDEASPNSGPDRAG
ncbi:hypothetical protein [Variovorax sp.]|nr:hypothetical protein [Variovorax sp.]HYP83528.1 hypothetical protein [Variovorax sp.]